MRAAAENFNATTLAKGIKFAHDHKVKVYVTCNILMHDVDIENLWVFIKQLSEAEADAVIVGDLGALATVREVAPNLDIHVSTQASVANTASAIEYAKMGAKRIILAREMSLKEIAGLRKNLDAAGYEKLDLEAFVHGAMCMSVSGRCLISSYLTGRSANKGACTQPCRWGYKLLEEKRDGQEFEIGEDGFGTYIMNSKDMNMLEYIDDLKAAGLSSIKIEGRNKKALYVATVVNAYRHVLDGEDPAKWSPELENVSHRPYSTGFYYGPAEQSPDYDGYEQNCVHVGDVLEDAKILCRNHFEEGETLEALIPGGDITSVKVQDLMWFPDAKSGGKPEKVANRATEIYSFATKTPLPPGTLLRSKTYLRTSRQ